MQRIVNEAAAVSRMRRTPAAYPLSIAQANESDKYISKRAQLFAEPGIKNI
jgi:hypothetical protein